MSNEYDQRYEESFPYSGESRDAPSLPLVDPIETLPKHTSRKRKHSELESPCIIGLSFSIQTHSSLPSPKAQKLTPRLMLPRACLPLAYLDPIGDAEDYAGSRLFAARIEILEGNNEHDQLPRVLIAESAADGRLHAVEKVQGGLFALCRLASWVDLRAIEQLQVSIPQHGFPQKLRLDDERSISKNEWWHSAAITHELDHNKDEIATPGLGKSPRAHLCLQGPVQGNTPASPAIPEAQRPTMPEPIQTALDGSVTHATQKAEDVYSMIRSQYQEALYASKASLAYFAKGPLSRARAAFDLSNDIAHSQSELVQFLRRSILVLATMDVKYRETLPDLVKDLPFGNLSEDEGEPVIAGLSKKIRKSKKTNVGKNGLYPGEELNIARWWLSRDTSSVSCDTAETREQATRAGLLEQRAKETQMQIILVLETLAIEASAPTLSVEQGPPQETAQSGEGSQKKTKRPKKQQDLATLLDLLADRLCIWQSMSVDEGNNSNKVTRPASQLGAKTTDIAAGSDQLRQFCVDVVLPFYAARLPELTALLCQKLGGPMQPSPRRPPLAKASTSSTSLRPGEAVQRVQARKPRRTLERVLTDERSASQKPPSLSRSATEPTLPKLKREVSDVTLSSIPLNRVAMHKRYSQREVDLNAASQASEAKLKKKAKVEQELHSAIAALKKPNPRMAVKELVEDAEKRVAGPHPKKSRNPVCNPLVQGVQIMATPSNNRHKDVFGGLPRLPRSNAAAPPTIPEDIPPSSISRINDSARKPQGSSSALVKESLRKVYDKDLSNVDQTPTRGPSKFLGRPRTSSGIRSGAEIAWPLISAAVLQPSESSVSHTEPPWSSTADETPTKDRAIGQSDRTEALGIEATTIKPSSIASRSEYSQNPTPSPQAQETTMSIYATLGWDDEIDELS